MKIIDRFGDRTCACFVFIVGNCEISVSTVFDKNKVEIAIFDKGSGECLKDRVSTISAAISWVDALVPKGVNSMGAQGNDGNGN